MNVWVVYPFSGDPCPPEAVFSTEEAARAWAAKKDEQFDKYGVTYYISKLTMNEPVEYE